MKTTRRRLLTMLGLGAAAAVAAPVASADAAPSQDACGDCRRVFAPAMLPEFFDRIEPTSLAAIQRGIHERALRENVAHEEAFMTLTNPTIGLIKDMTARALAEGYVAGTRAKIVPGDTARQCVSCGWLTPWSNAKPTMKTVWIEDGHIEQHSHDAHNGEEQQFETVWRRHESVDMETALHRMAEAKVGSVRYQRYAAIIAEEQQA